MKYKTKLFIATFFVSAISSLVALFSINYFAREYLFKFLQINIVSVAATTAANINPDEVKKVIETINTQNPEYQKLANQLRKVRNANRTADSYVKFLYITYPDPKDPEEFLIAVDAEESTSKDFSAPGTPDPGTGGNELSQSLKKNFVIDQPTTDPWGTWFTGYAPILDSQGNYVASVGADMSAQFVFKKLNHLRFFGVIAFAISLFISILIITFHANKVTRALRILGQATEEIRKGNYRFRIKINSKDEFEYLAQLMNQMSAQLEEDERIKSGITHYVSHAALNRWIGEKSLNQTEGQPRKVTVLACRVCDLTHLTKELKPHDTLALLNQYFKSILEIVFKQNGMIDRFDGDTIIAEFGIPMGDTDQAAHAVASALEMQKAVQVIDRQWKDKTNAPFKIQIAIHSDVTKVGQVENQTQYTSIDQIVDDTGRIIDWMKNTDQSIVLSHTTEECLDKKFVAVRIGSLVISPDQPETELYKIASLGQ